MSQREAPALYAWVEVEPDGSEGMIAAVIPVLGPVLLHHRQRHIAEAFRKLAYSHANASGRPVRFVEYRQTLVIQEYRP